MMLPHPVHVIMNLERRHEEFLAESAREHQARLAEQASGPPCRQRWADLLATLVVLVTLMLLVAAGASAFLGSSPVALPVAAIALT